MDIRSFAERILFGTCLEDKLAPPDGYDDRRPGPPLATPAHPGRPKGLALEGGLPRHRVRFTEVRGLHTEKDRGLVLHFFANHELLALELMALALLKFPQAPARFRRGLVKTLRDEQTHVRLYVERMAAIGVHFGDIPVSDFFWRSISPMDTPLDFVTGLSLTLEQANLDYAPHYAAEYQRLGDQPTAAILERIYRDEISHVKHGLLWFERWRDAKETQWQSYCRLLPPTLTPSRAKGIGFNRPARQRLGLTPDYIDELEIFSSSRGRCPALYWFNPACEIHLTPGRPPGPPPLRVRQLEADLASLPMFLCAPDDALLLPQRPSTAFLRRLQDLAFVLPQFIEYNPQQGIDATALGERPLGPIRPWACGPDSARFLAPLAGDTPLWQTAWSTLYAKSTGTQLLTDFLALTDAADGSFLCPTDIVGRLCTDPEVAWSHTQALWQQGWRQVVAKGDFGAAGREQLHLGPGQDPAPLRRRLTRLLQAHGGIVVEPWLPRQLDLSAQLELTTDGEARFLGWTRFLTDASGRFRGVFVAQQTAGLQAPLRRFLYGDGHDRQRIRRVFEAIAPLIARRAAAVGYTGPAGIDALIYRQDADDSLRLKPLVELNPRYTMGRLALQLRRRVNSARTAVWLLLGPGDLKASGCSDFGVLQDRLQQTHPPRLRQGLLDSGAVFTNDPTQAQAFVGLLVIGHDLAACAACLPHLEPLILSL